MLNLQTIKMRSRFSGTVSERVIAYKDGDLRKFFCGANIEDVMPYLNSHDKMFLITGITPDEADFIIERNKVIKLNGVA